MTEGDNSDTFEFHSALALQTLPKSLRCRLWSLPMVLGRSLVSLKLLVTLLLISVGLRLRRNSCQMKSHIGI